ncbi:MAG: hypothetical protein ACK5KT_14020 [Dysgonomonas sp.]
MKLINKHQGEDIAFSVRVWKDFDKTDPFDLDSVSEIVVYIYTDGCKKAMFSKTNRQGYSQLKKASKNEYYGVLDSSISTLMAPGTMTMEINIAESEPDLVEGKWNFISKPIIGVLKKSLIKIES